MLLSKTMLFGSRAIKMILNVENIFFFAEIENKESQTSLAKHSQLEALNFKILNVSDLIIFCSKLFQ